MHCKEISCTCYLELPQKLPQFNAPFDLHAVGCHLWHLYIVNVDTLPHHRHRGMILLHLHEWSPQIGMRKPENCRPASSSFPGTARFPRGVFIDTSDRRKFSSGQTRFTQDRWGPLLFLGAIVNDLPSEWVNDEQIYRGIVSNCFWFSALGWPCVWARHHQAIRRSDDRTPPFLQIRHICMWICVYICTYIAPPACSALSDKRLIILAWLPTPTPYIAADSFMSCDVVSWVAVSHHWHDTSCCKWMLQHLYL